MNGRLAQLTLSLNPREEATFDHFYEGSNVEIIAQLKKIAQGQGEQVIYLYGQAGEGLSHLLQAACHAAHQHQLTSVYLPLAELAPLSTEVLLGLETLSLICIDDLEAITGKADWEEALFHLYNRIYDTGGRIVMAAHHAPHALSIALPDLASRLSWGVVYALHPLTDDDKLAILHQHAARRGIQLSEEVGLYLLRHCPRHLPRLLAVLSALDKASLAVKRSITIPLVKEVLGDEA
jgi:DnaA family protein